HNPTGSVLSEDDIRAVAEVIREHDITVLSDEIYEHIIYDAAPSSIAALPGMLDRTVLFSGFSKTYAMTGWRLGYAVLPPALVEPVVRLIVNSVSCAPLFIQHAGIEALTGPQDSIPAMVKEFKERRDLIVDGLNRIPGISCRRPEGAFYVFPNVKQLNINCIELADILLNKAGVALLPGTHFGDCGDGYLRISYATSREKISQALLKIGRAVAELTASLNPAFPARKE
ncbi:MAG: aminotransferase class I/II-fold pyridoxal phosphate-dependent enzyme, partial [Dehalococcoidales bacterium]